MTAAGVHRAYVIARDTPIAELPGWLADILDPSSAE
jgi:hypothetical protein